MSLWHGFPQQDDLSLECERLTSNILGQALATIRSYFTTVETVYLAGDKKWILSGENPDLVDILGISPPPTYHTLQLASNHQTPYNLIH